MDAGRCTGAEDGTETGSCETQNEPQVTVEVGGDPMTFIEPDDLAPFATIPAEKAAAMIADAQAQAIMVAPCLTKHTLTPQDAAYVKAVLRRAILRWHEAGNAGSTVTHSQTAGPYTESQTEKVSSSRLFWPSEISDLQTLCARLDDVTKSTTVHTVSTHRRFSPHADICALRFGAVYCSCGANLTDYTYPLWEV